MNATAAAVVRLNRLLPLRERQQALPPALNALHRDILHRFAAAGVPPTRAEIAARPGIGDVDAALQRLAADDLVVLTADRRQVSGAYPFTTEPRLHRVRLNGHTVHAMCALDALAVAPLFGVHTQIDSSCHLSGVPVTIHMQGARVIHAVPAAPWVGIHWQGTSGCAAHSLCLEMVFLRDRDTAGQWQRRAPESISLFDLRHAIRLGMAFFCPLVS
jgi:hypothetical protein